ncbi:MAG: metallophosphoesterase [Clostridia bacterium]|nr:metallophosphoesterase [Clostridia bacterium]
MADPFLWIVDNELVIPGVRDARTFLHVSDAHLCVSDEGSAPAEAAEAAGWDARWMKTKEEFARHFGEPFGEAQRVSTREAFDRILAWAREEGPEALLLSGDNLERMHPAGERYLSRRLREYGGPFLCVPGNHEAEACPGAWESGVRTLEYGDFRIVAVDDRLMTVSDEALDRLAALAAEGLPMILVCHVPVAASGNREKMRRFGGYFAIDGETADGNGRRFVRFLEEADAVRMVLCGHIHGYSDTEIVPGKRQITASQGMIGFVHRLTVRGGAA